jgi:uncharacterized protein with HEPN domain
MPRDVRAYLHDILDCCDAITGMLEHVDLEAYRKDRVVRRAVEREFTIIGEAVLAISHQYPDTFASITHARRIVDFRNQLTHQYPSVNDSFVWGIAVRDVPVLRQECRRLLDVGAPPGSGTT